jgi:two-component system chemotaxis sensor kinase CheA
MNIKQKVLDKLNEVSMLLVMLGETDSQGLEIVVSTCRDICAEAKSEASLSTMVKVLEDAISKHGKVSTGESIKALNSALPMAQDAANGREVAISSSSAPSNQSSAIDTSLLTEYIETHLMALEDFEQTINDLETGSGTRSPEELETEIKRYLHNLKGDSGSIGVNDIERVCHAVEDTLVNIAGRTICEPLLHVRTWLGARLNDYRSNATPKEDGAKLIARFKSECSAAAPAPVKESAHETSSSHGGDHLKVDDTYVLTGDKEIFGEFAAEAEEHLNNIEGIILESEGDYTKDNIDTIFRGVHSLKGGSAYFTLQETTQTSHLLENLLSETRDGKRVFDEPLKNLCLVYIDLQKTLLAKARKAASGDCKIAKTPQSQAFLDDLDAYVKGASSKAGAKPASKPTASSVAAPAPAAKAAATSEAPPSANGKDNEQLAVKNFIKIDTSRLDHLIDSIGEMVIYSSMLVRQCREQLSNNEDIMNTTHRVEKFARDLQDIGMSMRLMPIRGLFQKMSRLVWDTAKKIGKEVNFVMHGEETELDRNLIDKLADPLMHMVRNAIDHGLETPDERVAAGKSRGGKVTLSAIHSGGSIHIKIEDDGRGLNPDKLLKKAIEKGIVKEDEVLTKDEIYKLIFAPGFSTAAAVTDLSGRGVGMDVVRKNVDSLRGQIDIKSEVNHGSIFTIEIPLTLAIIDGIDIRVGADHFIIPSLSIIEFIQPEKAAINYTLDRGETFQFRGKSIPVFRLGDLYDIKYEYNDPAVATFVVVDNGGEYVAVMVDEILGEFQTVIKGLGGMFEEGKGVSGCAIMPDGDVALILDIRSLLSLARSKYQMKSRVTGPAAKSGLQVSTENQLEH